MRTRLVASIVATMMAASPVAAAVIGFEDLSTPGGNGGGATLSGIGVQHTYQGYDWGFGESGGWANRNFSDSATGWAIGKISGPALSQAPAGVTGTNYAWTYNGRQSLWIDLRGTAAIASVDLSTLEGYPAGFNSNTVQAFGYNAIGTQLFASNVLSLTTAMHTLSLGFSGISYFELRSDRTGSWFSVDQLNFGAASGPGPVPEPAMIGLLGLGALAVGAARRRRQA